MPVAEGTIPIDLLGPIEEVEKFIHARITEELTKRYTEWVDKEVEKILYGDPAQTSTIPVGVLNATDL